MAKYPSASKIEAAGHELKVNPPKQLAKTAKKFGKADAERQRVAIMLSKARKGA
jgi:transposase